MSLSFVSSLFSHAENKSRAKICSISELYAANEKRVPFIEWRRREADMKDFASFTGGGSDKKSAADFEEQAKKLAKQYDGASEGDMLKAIYAQALEGKRNGTLTNEQIDAFYKQISPMLDGIKRKKLQKIVAELKKI